MDISELYAVEKELLALMDDIKLTMTPMQIYCMILEHKRKISDSIDLEFKTMAKNHGILAQQTK